MRKNWGEQWDTSAMSYLLNLGPNNLFNKSIQNVNSKKCLVIGAGQETLFISRRVADVIGVNITRDALPKKKQSNVTLIIADAQHLPVKADCFDFIVCKSTLHHLNDLALSLFEIRRVSQSAASIVLYEPGILNLIAFFGRKFFPTNIHDPTEKPFNPVMLRVALSKNFKIISEDDYFILIHAFPIIGKKIKLFRNAKLLKILFDLETLFCKTPLRNLSWILVFNLRNSKRS